MKRVLKVGVSFLAGVVTGAFCVLVAGAMANEIEED